GRGGREGGKKGRDKAARASRARGAEGEVPQGSEVQARVRVTDAGAATGLPVPLRRREAVSDADRPHREGDARDLRGTRVSGAAAIDRETVLYLFVCGGAYSHSIVPGGLDVTSYTTRLMPLTSLMIRVATRARKACSKGKEAAVMPSVEVTARSAHTCS